MDIGWKIVSAVAGVAAGIAANQIIKLGWKATTGHQPPQAQNDQVDFAELLTFTVVSAAVTAATRKLAEHQAAKWYRPVNVEKRKA